VNSESLLFDSLSDKTREYVSIKSITFSKPTHTYTHTHSHSLRVSSPFQAVYVHRIKLYMFTSNLEATAHHQGLGSTGLCAARSSYVSNTTCSKRVQCNTVRFSLAWPQSWDRQK